MRQGLRTAWGVGEMPRGHFVGDSILLQGYRQVKEHRELASGHKVKLQVFAYSHAQSLNKIILEREEGREEERGKHPFKSGTLIGCL